MLKVGVLVSAGATLDSDFAVATDFNARKCPLEAVGVGVGVGVDVLMLPPQPVANRSMRKNANRLSDFIERTVWAIFLDWPVEVVLKVEKCFF
jgi:hypothetical protein